ncbi:MAG: hypothetical protein SNJ77_11785 [Cytophagales bacterium]
MKKVMVVFYLAGISIFTLASCTKTVVLSDGERTKMIKVNGQIQMTKDENNQVYASFESAKGTKYNINTAEYQLKIK